MDMKLLPQKKKFDLVQFVTELSPLAKEVIELVLREAYFDMHMVPCPIVRSKVRIQLLKSGWSRSSVTKAFEEIRSNLYEC